MSNQERAGTYGAAHARGSVARQIMTTKLITVDAEIHSGTPVFVGARVPIRTLFDHLGAGDSIDVFLDDFPSVSRELAVAVLEQARVALVLLVLAATQFDMLLAMDSNLA